MLNSCGLLQTYNKTHFSFPSYQNVSQNVGNGCAAGGQQQDGSHPDRQWDFPPFLPVCLHVCGRLVPRRSPGQRLCVRVALLRAAGVPAHAAHHLPPQAEEHHLIVFLGSWLQQRRRELLHQHGDLQHLFSEVHHLCTLYLRARSVQTHV